MKSLYGVLCAALLLAWPYQARAAACADDKVNWIKTDDACFAVQTYANSSDGTLVVFIHGDSGVSRKGKNFSAYQAQIDALKAAEANLVVLSRPGYSLDDGRSTLGTTVRDYDNYTRDVVDNLNEALLALKSYHNAKKLVLLGHSGGAMLSGIIAGRHPGTADAVVLVGFACNKSKWRRWRKTSAGKKSMFKQSLSAHDFLEDVPKDMPIVAITGGSDNNTKASFAEECVADWNDLGVKATLTTVPGKGHLEVMDDPAITQAVLGLR